jgi:hypothetical protein
MRNRNLPSKIYLGILNKYDNEKMFTANFYCVLLFAPPNNSLLTTSRHKHHK